MTRANDIAIKGTTIGDERRIALEVLPEAFSRYEPDEQERLAGRAERLRDATRRAGAFFRSCLEEEAEFGHLFYWTPVFVGAGAVLWFSAASTPSTTFIGVILVLSSVATRILRYRRPVAAAVFAALVLLAAGALLAAWETDRGGTVILDTPVTTTVKGVVIGREAIAGGRWRYTVDVIETDRPRLRRAPARVTLTAPGGKAPAALGATLEGRARLLTPSGPALVGLNDFAFDAYFSGYGAIGFFYGSPKVIASDEPAARSPYQAARLFLEELRGRISARIRSVLPGDTGAFAASMVTDDRRAISKETMEALTLAGLTHVVAISGLNMALAAGIFFVGIRALLSLSQELAHRYPIKKIAAAGAFLTVTGYYLISGFAVSAERAYVMMAIMLTAAMFGRPSISLRNVALSALLILVMSPSAVMGPGFQMSYAATIALVAGYAAWQRRRGTDARSLPAVFLTPISLTWTFVSGVFVTSLIGGASTALFSIEHFHRIAAWGLPANLLAMPIISLVVMPAGLAALVLMPVGLDWVPLQLMGLGLDLVLAIAKWTASLGGDVATGRMHGWLFVGLTACLITLGIMRSKLRYAGLIIAAPLLAMNFVVPPVARPDLIVHEDGQLVGLVMGDRIATTASRPTGFVFEQWQRALPVHRHVRPLMEGNIRPARHGSPFGDAEKRAAVSALRRDSQVLPIGRFRCREGLWCAARAWNGSRIIVTEIRDLVGIACDHADLVVTSARLSWSECHSGAKLLSVSQLRRWGTLEIRFEPENIRQFRITSGLGAGDRPWYVHRIFDWRSGEYIRLEGQTPGD